MEHHDRDKYKQFEVKKFELTMRRNMVGREPAC